MYLESIYNIDFIKYQIQTTTDLVLILMEKCTVGGKQKIIDYAMNLKKISKLNFLT